MFLLLASKASSLDEEISPIKTYAHEPLPAYHTVIVPKIYLGEEKRQAAEIITSPQLHHQNMVFRIQYEFLFLGHSLLFWGFWLGVFCACFIGVPYYLMSYTNVSFY